MQIELLKCPSGTQLDNKDIGQQLRIIIEEQLELF